MELNATKNTYKIEEEEKEKLKLKEKLDVYLERAKQKLLPYCTIPLGEDMLMDGFCILTEEGYNPQAIYKYCVTVKLVY